MKRSVFVTVIAAVMLAGCSNSHYTREGGEITTADVNKIKRTEAVTVTETAEAYDILVSEDIIPHTVIDREGNEITVPENVERIVSVSPSATDILCGLGLGGKIVSADTASADIAGIDPSVCTLDVSDINAEAIAALAPDAVIIGGSSPYGEDGPYRSLTDAGINVIYIPVSSSIESIKLDIEFLAAYTGTKDIGAKLNEDIDRAVAEVSIKAMTVPEKKKVYFETGTASDILACGGGTLADDIINLIGAENIYGGAIGYFPAADETVIAADPDVILSGADGHELSDISSRTGWENIRAVHSGEVYSLDAASLRPSQNIIKGIYRLAEAVYPEVYG